ncbi:hypothetical protein MMPV_008811 [Pyropia vietnamensis]
MWVGGTVRPAEAPAGDKRTGRVGDRGPATGFGAGMDVPSADNEDTVGRRFVATGLSPPGTVAAATRTGDSPSGAVEFAAREDAAATSGYAPIRHGVSPFPSVAAAATWDGHALDSAPTISPERPAMPTARFRFNGTSMGVEPLQTPSEAAAAIRGAPAGLQAPAVRGGAAAPTLVASGLSTTASESRVAGQAPAHPTHAEEEPPPWGTPASAGGLSPRPGVVATPSAAATGRSPTGVLTGAPPGELPAPSTAAAWSATTAAG